MQQNEGCADKKPAYKKHRDKLAQRSDGGVFAIDQYFPITILVVLFPELIPRSTHKIAGLNTAV